VEDLALRQPGAAARDQARRARDAAPFRVALARLLHVHADERAWRIGADGEVLVAAQLEKLRRRDPRWQVLHSLPLGRNGADIDHLLIGPGGVFVLNTKHHPNARIWVAGDALRVNGSSQPYVRNSRHEAERASRLLTAACGVSVAVTGVIVLVNAQDIVVKRSPADVHVVNRRRLRRLLRRQPEILDRATVAEIFATARRPDTWLGQLSEAPRNP